MKDNLKKWLLFGILFIIILGSLAHFMYEWSGKNPIMGLLTAVNESTWEHIKLAIFPSLILLLIQYPFLKNNKNFFVGTFLSMLTMILLIPIIFYGYQAIIGKDIFILDILDFIISVIIGQFIFYKVMKLKVLPMVWRISSIIGIIIITFGYLTFSYFPPRTFIFEDPITKTYGINK